MKPGNRYGVWCWLLCYFRHLGKFEIYSFRQLETPVESEAWEHAVKCPFRRISLVTACRLVGGKEGDMRGLALDQSFPKNVPQCTYTLRSTSKKKGLSD